LNGGEDGEDKLKRMKRPFLADGFS